MTKYNKNRQKKLYIASLITSVSAKNSSVQFLCRSIFGEGFTFDFPIES